MTITTLIAVLIIGIVILSIGIFTKKSWLKLISLIPIGVALYHIIYLSLWWFSL
ncbi:hypothetical protein [Sutcliffiella horikoshii]|uniref:hypothetical protein n=1 Tax=Sutcliffiella horikoshii TaxID=79883 RepID=UPI001CA3E655|nr:hypothetical protein [Sutcliffiella horikoshii]